jgi:hypothetical protein
MKVFIISKFTSLFQFSRIWILLFRGIRTVYLLHLLRLLCLLFTFQLLFRLASRVSRKLSQLLEILSNIKVLAILLIDLNFLC